MRSTYTVGWKFNYWELRGVPVRIEIGPKDIAKGEYVAAVRYSGAKISHEIESVEQDIPKLLDEIQDKMYEKAKMTMDDHVVKVTKWDDFVPTLNQKNLILVPWCESVQCETDIKANS